MKNDLLRVYYVDYNSWIQINKTESEVHPHQKHISVAKIITNGYNKLNFGGMIFTSCTKEHTENWLCNVIRDNKTQGEEILYNGLFSTLSDFEQFFYTGKHIETIMELEL